MPGNEEIRKLGELAHDLKELRDAAEYPEPAAITFLIERLIAQAIKVAEGDPCR
jgi:hypothetical protein